MSNDTDDIPKSRQFMDCEICERRTTPEEAEHRKFNTGKCAVCGGELYLVWATPDIRGQS